jgi:hypothetical protein
VIDRLGPAGAVGNDVEADHVFGAGKHLTTDLPDTRRLGRERRVGVDVENTAPVSRTESSTSDNTSIAASSGRSVNSAGRSSKTQ